MMIGQQLIKREYVQCRQFFEGMMAILTEDANVVKIMGDKPFFIWSAMSPNRASAIEWQKRQEN